MIRLIKIFPLIICISLFSGVISAVFAGDYSVKIANNLTNSATCNQVRLLYWSGGTGSQANSSSPLRAHSPQTLTIKNANPCSSVELQVSCRYFQTTYSNYGSSRQTGWSGWMDRTTTQKIACGKHSAIIDLALTDYGNVQITVLDIKAQ